MPNSISAAARWKPSSRAFRPVCSRSTRTAASPIVNQALLRMFHPDGHDGPPQILRGRLAGRQYFPRKCWRISSPSSGAPTAWE